MWGRLEGGKRLIRRALTWDERLTLTEWYLDRCGIREYSEQNLDRAARDRTIVYLLGAGQTEESIAQSFGLTVGGVTRIVNRLKKETGVTAEIQAAKSRGRVPLFPGHRCSKSMDGLEPARAAQPDQRKKGRDDTEVGKLRQAHPEGDCASRRADKDEDQPDHKRER